MTDFTDAFIASQKERLLDMREELVAQGQRNKEALDTVELDQSKVGRLSRMDALQNQAMAQETERRRLAQIQRIDTALQRIEDGEYGYCLNTGHPIDIKRLELDPAAPTAVRPKDQ